MWYFEGNNDLNLSPFRMLYLFECSVHKEANSPVTYCLHANMIMNGI